MQCELCGKDGQVVKARIEGVILTVCDGCGSLGDILSAPPAAQKRYVSPPKQETVYTIVDNYSQMLKHKRESLGLTQEDFARKINEKISVIHHLESGKLEPSIDLARKLEKALGLRLVQENQLQHDADKSERKGAALTIGDIIQLKK